MTEPVEQTSLPYSLHYRGKVRDVYELDGPELLMVASDRISAFDCVLPDPIPDKGTVLTQLSAFWFRETDHLMRNHCLSADPEEMIARRPELGETRDAWAGRGMLVERSEPFPVECVVRGYLAGSGWREYRDRGTLAGKTLPRGLEEGDELPEARFTPATKAEEGHDENITLDEMEEIVGVKTADLLRERSLDIYRHGREVARERGVIVADTKLEFGTSLRTGEILLIDEVLTPDSSRFWPEEEHSPGGTQPSLDKQPVRDWLEQRVREGQWDREPPAPELTPEVVESTAERYRTAFRRLTGSELPTFRP